MTAVAYPVAANAESALHDPMGHASREHAAAQLAAGEVAFVTEAVGPAFDTREAALDAYAGRLEDERPDKPQIPPEARWCVLRPVIATQPGRRARRAPLQPTNRDGRRWPVPDPEQRPKTAWRLSISYWRTGGADLGGPLDPARQLRRDRDQGPGLDGRSLHRLASQPLRPVKPQQPLDMGLFEVHPPEAPHLLIPDE